jgi:site-specific DNA-methyltransferase (adenine-specific)
MQKAYEEGLVVQLKGGAVPQYKKYLQDSKGRTITNCWTDIPQAAGKESLGYPTQKPITLLKRIILMSSDEGQTVLDPFCGCATTICAAHELNRKWIGIDIAYHAIKRVAQLRLQDDYGLVEGTHYTVAGVPRTLEGAQRLWQQDKYGFQRWAVEQVNGFVTTRRTADGGIDGRVWFSLPGEKQLRSMVVEVKGGKNVGINVMRALRGALERDEAAMAGLIIMEPLPDRQRQNFMKEMNAGMLDVMGVQYPRMQILSVPEILDKRMFLTPTVAGRGTGQGSLPLEDTR